MCCSLSDRLQRTNTLRRSIVKLNGLNTIWSICQKTSLCELQKGGHPQSISESKWISETNWPLVCVQRTGTEICLLSQRTICSGVYPVRRRKLLLLSILLSSDILMLFITNNNFRVSKSTVKYCFIKSSREVHAITAAGIFDGVTPVTGYTRCTHKHSQRK